MAKERKASVMYEGNASQLVYAFPFDYLRKKFVKVEDIYTNITELTMGVDYTVEDKQVRLVKGIPLGHSVKIYRETTTAPLVEWQDASVLRSADLSLQEVQLLHLAEETADKVFDSGMSTAYDNPNCWDGQYKRIINALDPIEDGDVVTLRYIKANQDSLLNQLKNTGATQNSSIVATGDTQNARLVSTGDNQNTRLTTTGDTQNTRLVTTGDSYVSTMTTLRDATTTKATEANNSADLAKKWAVSTSSPDGATDSKSSKTWAEAAKVSAGNAASSASTAQSSAETASYYANAARAYAEAPRGQAPNGSTSARLWAKTAGSKASDAASSASASASSASNAATSASNAKSSETNAANSAAAAAQSAIDAAKFDPSSYYLKSEVDAKIPTKLSQLTDYVQEAQKWKDAYNNLRKRSYPTTFDREELTLLTNTSSDSSGITLSKPYTNFDGLLLEITDENNEVITILYVSTEEIERNKTEASTLANQFFLVNTYLFYVCSTQGLSSTFFPRVVANCVVMCVYGVKFKEIT